jgi:uncharacterized protein (TIGR01777 family)
MRFLVTGATGLIGRRLVIDRLERGDQVVVVSRDPGRAEQLFAAGVNPNVSVVAGEPGAPGPWQTVIDGCDVVVHLAGASIAHHRWTDEYKTLIQRSRVESTYQVVRAIREAEARPSVLISASTIGYYGETADELVSESAAPGTGFLADVAVAWEEQAMRAAEYGTRAICLRLGHVIDVRGGALGALAGGSPSAGRSYVSWIHWRDVIGIVDFLLAQPEAIGAYNATAPTAVPRRDLAKAVGKSSVVRAPSVTVRAAYSDCRVTPRRLVELGYQFLYEGIEEAVRAELDEAQSKGDATKQPVATTSSQRTPDERIALVAVDVDDTLLRSDGRLAEGVVKACRLASSGDCVVVLATSRPPRAVRSILEALDLVSPVIVYNGAAIWNPVDDKPQHHEPLDGELTRRIVRDARAESPDVLVGLELLDRWCTDRVDVELAAETGLVIEPDDIGPLEPHFKQPVTKLELAGSPEMLTPVLEMLKATYWRERDVAVFTPHARVIQVTHPLVDKGIALQRIANRMGVGKSQVMAIGASDNDLGMLEWAGFSVVVSNACPAALALADHVVPSNDEHGVARALHRFVLSPEQRSGTLGGA